MASEVPVIRVDKLCKSFDRAVLRDISLDISFLRCLNHLELPTSGEIYIDGEPMGFRIDATGKRRSRGARILTESRKKARIRMVP
jgi:ABC-type histidine transport system ATPase subunit